MMRTLASKSAPLSVECEMLASVKPDMSTPEFNTRGVFDRDDDACSDCSDCSCATADLQDCFSGLGKGHDQTLTAIVAAPTTDSDDDACSACSWVTADDFDDRSWRVAGPVKQNLVEFTPITPYTPPVTITLTFAPTVPSVTSTPGFNTCGTFDRSRDADACSDCSFASTDLFDEDMPRRRWKKHAEKVLVPFTPAASVVQCTKRLPWDTNSLFAKGHGSQSSQSSNVGGGDTTVMLHNVPCTSSTRTRQFLFDKFAELGFTNDCMDYVYIPMREKRGYQSGTGYMFVNLNTAELAASFCEAINGCNLTAPTRKSKAAPKTVLCSLAVTQGVDANVEHFLSSKGLGLRNPVWVRRGAEWSPLLRD